MKKVKNKSYTWKKGKRKIVAEITMLNKHYVLQQEMKMKLRMSLAGWRLV